MAEVKIAADSGGGSVGLAGPATTTSNAAVQFKLPVADGSAGQVLKTDGSGNLSWYTLPTYTNGITEYDQWRINANLSNLNSNVITANWERDDRHFEKIGTGLTESSGIFTFPSTGKYLINYYWYASGNNDRYVGGNIQLSDDSGSNWLEIADALGGVYEGGSGTYDNASCSALVDITNISTFRMRFEAQSVGTVTYQGSTNIQRTGFTCIRLGDT